MSELRVTQDELDSLRNKHNVSVSELNSLQATRAGADAEFIIYYILLYFFCLFSPDPSAHRNKTDSEQLKTRLNYVELQLRTAQVELSSLSLFICCEKDIKSVLYAKFSYGDQ